jgi:hypothetical protein
VIDNDVSAINPSVREAVRGLAQTSRHLRVTGLLAAAWTLALIAGVILAMTGLLPFYARQVLPWSVVLGFGNIVVVIIHEALRRRGDAVFEEISDDLQWHLARANRESPASVSDRPKPDLEARLALREYVKATDLPLIVGPFGPAYYVLLNVITLVAFIWMALRYLL